MPIYPPDKIEVSDVKNGIAQTIHSVAEVEAHGWGDISEDERTKLLEELADSNNTGGPFNIGGYGHWRGREDARSLWTPKEKKEWRDFYRLSKKGMNDELQRRFGTTDMREFEKHLNEGMKQDPRLNILTRRGIVKTTAAEQEKFGLRFAALELVKR